MVENSNSTNGTGTAVQHYTPDNDGWTDPIDPESGRQIQGELLTFNDKQFFAGSGKYKDELAIGTQLVAVGVKAGFKLWQDGACLKFVTEIDGLDIHFIHVRSKHENALPLIVTHGWPGSVIEQLKIIDPLTNPTAHSASASDAFHLVLPSLPGFGFSGKPIATGWGPERTARAWVELMKRLGYAQFVAQGGDLGAGVCTAMGRLAPAALLGIHTNLPGTIPPDIAKSLALGDAPPPTLSADEKRAYEELAVLFAKRRAYAQMMATRPQTLYGLSDSPVGLAAWVLDHGDGYGQPAAAIMSAVLGRTINGHPAYDLTRDEVLDDITLYWLTNTAVSAARYYWEQHINLYNRRFRPGGGERLSRREL